jgi:RHS repeat-associated protein
MVLPDRSFTAYSYRFGYQGQFAEKDKETGYSHFEARLYDVRLSRWMTPDPAGQFFSTYLGMGNNWVNGVDPDGGWFDNWEIDGSGNANLVDTEGDNIYVNGELISDFDFKGNYDAIGQIGDYYAKQGGVIFDNKFDVLDLYSSPTNLTGFIRGANYDAKYSEVHTGFSFSIKRNTPKIWLSDGNMSSTYDNKFNFINAMVHEGAHQRQGKTGFSSWSVMREIDALYTQSVHSSFKHTTKGFRAIMTDYVNMNMPALLDGVKAYPNSVYGTTYNRTAPQINKAYGTNY